MRIYFKNQSVSSMCHRSDATSLPNDEFARLAKLHHNKFRSGDLIHESFINRLVQPLMTGATFKIVTCQVLFTNRVSRNHWHSGTIATFIVVVGPCAGFSLLLVLSTPVYAAPLDCLRAAARLLVIKGRCGIAEI